MNEEIKKLPKVELHIHLDGSVSFDLASKLSGLSIEEVKKRMVAKNKCENLSEYLEKFDFPISLMQTEENLYEISKDLVNKLEKENVVYAEIRFSPLFHTKKGLTLEKVVEAVIKGLNSNKNVKTNLILCMMRGMKKEDNYKVINLAKKYKDKGVCALDLAGAEDKYPIDEYIELFEIAKKENIPFTIHAGENGSSLEIKKAIDIGAKRIGHGIHSIEDEKVLDLIKKEKILLELCPTSNVQTNAVSSLKFHPIKEFYKRKILVNINTDNITVSNTTLNKEYLKLYDTFNFQVDDFKKMNMDAIKKSFASRKIKNQLLNKFYKN